MESAAELIDTMTEGVWKCFVRKNEASRYSKQYKISNMKSEVQGVELRIISKEKPMENAVLEMQIWKMYFCITSEKRQVKKMLRFELKKIFSKTVNKIVLLVLLAVLLAASF